MDHTCELIRQAKEGNMEARSRLVEENVGLVWSVVRRFQGRGYENEDLFQIGSIGLIKCIDHFDLDRDVKFSTYAVPLIVGEIRRFLRDDGMVKVSRSLKETYYKIRKETENYQNEHHREPTIDEISATLQMDQADVLMALESSQEIASLHQVIYQGDGDEIHLEDRIEQQTDEIEKALNRMYIRELMDRLSQTERTLIQMRYFQNKTQSAVAEKLGISQVQVSRLEKKILTKLRREYG